MDPTRPLFECRRGSTKGPPLSPILGIAPELLADSGVCVKMDPGLCAKAWKTSQTYQVPTTRRFPHVVEKHRLRWTRRSASGRRSSSRCRLRFSAIPAGRGRIRRQRGLAARSQKRWRACARRAGGPGDQAGRPACPIRGMPLTVSLFRIAGAPLTARAAAASD